MSAEQEAIAAKNVAAQWMARAQSARNAFEDMFARAMKAETEVDALREAAKLARAALESWLAGNEPSAASHHAIAALERAGA